MYLFQVGVVLGTNAVEPLIPTDLVVGFMKFLFIVAFGLYAAFAFIATRQIKNMRTTLITPYSDTLALLGWVHLAVALILLVLFLLVL
jgi:hypothetical protein